MGFKSILQKALKSKLSKAELKLLPGSYQQIGHICVLYLNSKLEKHSKLIATQCLEHFPRFLTVAMRGKIKGKLRQPELKYLAGVRNFETKHKEHKCIFALNASKVMLSKGNHKEKERMVKQVKKGEVVFDMFAGIGYWSIPIAKLAKPSGVFAVELNPDSFKYLKMNMYLNGVDGILEPILGDSRKEATAIKADRIIMGYLPDCHTFLPAAFKASKKGTIIHYHGLEKNKEYNVLSNDIKLAAKKAKIDVKILKNRRIKKYAPHVDHVVVDFKVL